MLYVSSPNRMAKLYFILNNEEIVVCLNHPDRRICYARLSHRTIRQERLIGLAKRITQTLAKEGYKKVEISYNNISSKQFGKEKPEYCQRLEKLLAQQFFVF